MASPIFISYASSGLYGSGTVSKPSGVVDGDLMLMFIRFNRSDFTLIPPSGWNEVITIDENSQWGPELHCYWKIAASEPPSYSISGGIVQGYAVIAAYRGVAETPINVYGNTETASSASVNCPSVTTTVPDTTVVSFYTEKFNDGSVTYAAPSGMTSRASIGFGYGQSCGFADVAQASAGASGVKTATASASITSYGITVAVAGFSGGTDATAPGTTVTGTGTVSAGSATGGGSATGTFTFDACENNTHSGILNNVAVNWAWHSGGAVGYGTVITNGTGTMTTAGMTISGIPTGVGYGTYRSVDGTVVGYEEGTVT